MIQVLHQVVNYKQLLHYQIMFRLQPQVYIVILHIIIVQQTFVNVYREINSVILISNVKIKRMNYHVHQHVRLNKNHYVNGHMIQNKNLNGTLVVVEQHHSIQVQALVKFDTKKNSSKYILYFISYRSYNT